MVLMLGSRGIIRSWFSLPEAQGLAQLTRLSSTHWLDSQTGSPLGITSQLQGTESKAAGGTGVFWELRIKS